MAKLNIEEIFPDCIPTVSEMKGTTQQTSALSEAVAALSLQGAPSKSPNVLNADTDCSGNDNGRTDSGYASQISTPESSNAASIDNDSLVKRSGLWPNLRRKTVKLKAFDIAIPQLTKDRFEDLRELYAEDINKLIRGLPRYSGILMALKVLGESESEARPWVFVQCDKIVAKKLRSFFKRPIVKADFQPPNPTTYSPHFEIYICELPPKPLMRLEDLEQGERTTVIDIDKCALQSNTLCGMAIKANIGGNICFATVGGLIEVIKDEEHSKVFAMTAGHFLEGDQEELEDSLNPEFEMEGVSDDDDESASYSTDGDNFELELGPLSSNFYAPPSGLQFCLADVPASAGTSTFDWSELGVVYKKSSDMVSSGNNLDWALLEVDGAYRNFPNMVLKDEVKRAYPASGFGREIKLSAGVSGFQSGILSGSWAYLLLAPGKTMTKTYVLKLYNDKVLQNGDSGAWVVDAVSNEVYGHVVASDVFGNAYVVPLESTFLDIKRQLFASSVGISRAPRSTQIQKPPDLPQQPSSFFSVTTDIITQKAVPHSEEAIHTEEIQNFPMDDYELLDPMFSVTKGSRSEFTLAGGKTSNSGYDSGYSSANISRESSVPDTAAHPSLLARSIREIWHRSSRQDGSQLGITDVDRMKAKELPAVLQHTNFTERVNLGFGWEDIGHPLKADFTSGCPCHKTFCSDDSSWERHKPVKSAGDHELPCEFTMLNCSRRFPLDKWEEWIAHSKSHFVNTLLPPKAECIFCSDKIFEDPKNRHANWRNRMIHIRHHLKDFKGDRPSSRPDYFVLEYLRTSGLLRDGPGETIVQPSNEHTI